MILLHECGLAHRVPQVTGFRQGNLCRGIDPLAFQVADQAYFGETLLIGMSHEADKLLITDKNDLP